MANLKTQIATWLSKNQEQLAENLTKTQVEKAYKAYLKSEKVSKETCRLEYFRYVRGCLLKGTLTVKAHQLMPDKKVLEAANININHWRPKNDKVDLTMFAGFKTGKGIDIIFSNEGGIVPGTSYILHGGPGAGKTTVLADVQYHLQKNYKNAKIACVQSEMKKLDINYEFLINKMDWMGDLNYVILKDYGYENIKQVLLKIFKGGYDVLFIDSFEDIVGKLVAFEDMSTKEASHFLLELMDMANEGANETGVLTAVIAIQQETKGGDFKGDNTIKHLTSGMLKAQKDVKGNRYLSFSKNRRCGTHVDKKLYFSLTKEKTIKYDTELFFELEEQAKFVSEEKEAMAARTKEFFNEFELKIDEGNVIVNELEEEAA